MRERNGSGLLKGKMLLRILKLIKWILGFNLKLVSKVVSKEVLKEVSKEVSIVVSVEVSKGFK